MNDAGGREIVEKRVVRNGIENEIEASIVLDLNTAKVMLQWLDNSIKNSETIMQKIQESIAKK